MQATFPLSGPDGTSRRRDAVRHLRISVGLLDDRLDPGLLHELEAEPVRMSSEMLDWFRGVADRIEGHPDMTVSSAAGDHVPLGELDAVEIHFCSPSAFEILLDQPEGVIGVHMVSTPETDPFGDDAPESRAFRIVIPWEPDWVTSRIEEAVEDHDGHVDPEELSHGAMAWLVTLTHELHHVIWFAGNGNFNSPADLDVMVDEIGHDLFDVNTGYGIRPPIIDGVEVEPDCAASAQALLEEMVEERGRRLAEDVFQGEFSPDAFLDLLSREAPRLAARRAEAAPDILQP